jgi:hypothetical protein
MFKATYTITYALGNPDWKFKSGTGVAISHSPKTAMRLAQRQADRSCGEAAAWGVIFAGGGVTDLVTGKTHRVGDFV